MGDATCYSCGRTADEVLQVIRSAYYAPLDQMKADIDELVRKHESSLAEQIARYEALIKAIDSASDMIKAFKLSSIIAERALVAEKLPIEELSRFAERHRQMVPADPTIVELREVLESESARAYQIPAVVRKQWEYDQQVKNVEATLSALDDEGVLLDVHPPCLPVSLFYGASREHMRERAPTVMQYLRSEAANAGGIGFEQALEDVVAMKRVFDPVSECEAPGETLRQMFGETVVGDPQISGESRQRTNLERYQRIESELAHLPESKDAVRAAIIGHPKLAPIVRCIVCDGNHRAAMANPPSM